MRYHGRYCDSSIRLSVRPFASTRLSYEPTDLNFIFASVYYAMSDHSLQALCGRAESAPGHIGSLSGLQPTFLYINAKPEP